MLRGVGQGRAVTACAGKRPTARKKDHLLAEIRVTLCIHKTGRWGKATGGLAAGNPARPRCHRFIDAQCDLILRALRAQAAPSRPRPPPLRKFGKDGRANSGSLPLRGEHAAGAGAPLEIAAAVAGGLNVFRRVQRHGWFRGKDGF